MGFWSKVKAWVFGSSTTKEEFFHIKRVGGKTTRRGWVRLNGKKRSMTEEEMDQMEREILARSREQAWIMLKYARAEMDKENWEP